MESDVHGVIEQRVRIEHPAGHMTAGEEPFYPKHIPKLDWLSLYAAQFASTEINCSFYRTPSLEAVRAWRKQTPPDFLFAWEGVQVHTRWKQLNAETSGNSVVLMMVFGHKLGPVLFQLPATSNTIPI